MQSARDALAITKSILCQNRVVRYFDNQLQPMVQQAIRPGIDLTLIIVKFGFVYGRRVLKGSEEKIEEND